MLLISNNHLTEDCASPLKEVAQACSVHTISQYSIYLVDQVIIPHLNICLLGLLPLKYAHQYLSGSHRDAHSE